MDATAIEAIGALAASSNPTATAPASEAVEPNAFIDLLTQIDDSVAKANESLVAMAEGASEAPVHELMIALEVSKLELQLLVEVRNRLVEGYQELTRMQV